ncbi:hypothetical protein ACNPNU_05060 [Pseudomonas shirazica]|uniref:hypothetical protein n=1 Tax=Pseudomonas shirazica TaxID=1940636 RepID=UPI003AACD4E2
MEIRELKTIDYVPGVSGIRLDLKTGAVEINGGRLAAGSLPSEPQMITITAGEWAESDMPANAVERYRFIGDQLMAVPDQHRGSAEFSTEDISFDRDGSDVRTTLSYQRLETAEEVAARVSSPADSVVISERGDVTVTSGGRVIARFGCWKEVDQPTEQPFAVEGGKVFVSQSAIERATWRVCLALDGEGRYVAAGIGAGVEPSTESAISEALASAAFISPLSFRFTDPAEHIRQVIREELLPGRLLHRRW